MRKTINNFYDIDDIKKLVTDAIKASPLAKDVSKLNTDVSDIKSKMNNVNNAARIINENEQSLKKMNTLDEAVRILRENEQNLKELGGLKHRLDTLDKIMVTVDKIAGDLKSFRETQELNSATLSDHNDRLEKVESHFAKATAG